MSELSVNPVAQTMRRLAERVGEHLRQLGLTISCWEPSGAAIVPPAPINDYCRQMCAAGPPCLEALSALVEKAAQDGRSAIGTAPNGCCLLAVPVSVRRRLKGAIAACFPPLGVVEGEAFARTCGRLRLDQQAMQAMGRQASRHEAREAESLCAVLEWLIQDEQGKEVARDELSVLSTNLANTYEELALLYRISGSMNVTNSATDYFQNLCRELMEVMPVAGAAAVLYPRDHAEGREVVVRGGRWPADDPAIVRLVRGGLSGRLGAVAEAMVDNDFALSELEGCAGLDNLVAVPLVGGQRCNGVLLAINKHRRDPGGVDDESIPVNFDSVDLKLVSSIGAQAAMFLENHYLYQDLQELLMGVLHALTSSIDAKDPYTCGHSRRVATIARKLARMLGFDERRAGMVYLGGLLHDVGKIGMPETVLLKPGKLTDLEFCAVKKHPRVGARILSGIRQLDEVMPAILHHHERLDGRGYPDGLAGERVPMEARIVGLADSFDAMTSCRTYRTAMPLETATAEIRRCSGTQFDPRLVELLLSLDLEAYLRELREETGPGAQALSPEPGCPTEGS